MERKKIETETLARELDLPGEVVAKLIAIQTKYAPMQKQSWQKRLHILTQHLDDKMSVTEAMQQLGIEDRGIFILLSQALASQLSETPIAQDTQAEDRLAEQMAMRMVDQGFDD
ncbi:MAG: hypothetical protein MRY32_09365 [Rickettsiales bacterium]|nr:hypothetical protein [Rickettsiales bacterium]